ncbi:MAG: hypothetical protein ACFFCO_10015 [Promethearchaeota archaeon]
MGLRDRLRSWLRRRRASDDKSASGKSLKGAGQTFRQGAVGEITERKGGESIAHSLELSGEPKIDKLLKEYQKLELERFRLRSELDIIEKRLALGAITEKERNGAYRTRLSRAGKISIRQGTIRTKLRKMGCSIHRYWRVARPQPIV